jgi:hypothetical protein
MVAKTLQESSGERNGHCAIEQYLRRIEVDGLRLGSLDGKRNNDILADARLIMLLSD